MSELINIALSDVPTVVSIDNNFKTLNTDKLEIVNIIQGQNITFEIDGKNIKISAIGGTDGKNIEMRYSDTYLQYRLVGDLDWINLVQIESTVELSGKVATLETNQGDLTSVPTDLQNKTIAEMITTNFTSVSKGKTLVANAITDKGVQTLVTDTFQTMANNIGLISVSLNEPTYVYNTGDECINISGGWIDMGTYGTTTGSSFTKDATNIKTTLSTNSSSGAHKLVRTQNVIDLSNFNILRMIVSRTDHASTTSRLNISSMLYTTSSQISSVHNNSVAQGVSSGVANMEEIQLNISKLYGTYYFYYESTISTLNVPLQTFLLHSIRLEI